MRDFDRQFSFALVNCVTILYSIKSVVANADGTNIIMFLLSCSYLLHFITNVVNNCVLDNTVPDEWKISHVIPVPKVVQTTEC